MALDTTVVFIDLAGSSAAYEALDPRWVASLVSKVTRWAGRVCHAYGSESVKLLGDGVLAWFARAHQGVSAAVFLQQRYDQQVRNWPPETRPGLKIGIASGPVVRLHADAYGDAVNLAARLSDMAGGQSIWIDEATLQCLRGLRPQRGSAVGRKAMPMLSTSELHMRSLGEVHVPGLEQAHLVHQVFWNKESREEPLTRPATFDEIAAAAEQAPAAASLTLHWAGLRRRFESTDLIVIGRLLGSSFLINDPRVSRRHANIAWKGRQLELTDTSSYGTWVRFSDHGGEPVCLRRRSCILHGDGELSLSAPFSDPDAPRVRFLMDFD